MMISIDHDLRRQRQWLAKKSHKWMWSLFPLVEYFETNFGVCIKATGKQVSSPPLVDVCLQFSRSGLAIALVQVQSAKSGELFRCEDYICEERIAGETCQC